jgi:hypothetical protein
MFLVVNGGTKARINGAGFEPLIAAGASKIGFKTSLFLIFAISYREKNYENQPIV